MPFTNRLTLATEGAAANNPANIFGLSASPSTANSATMTPPASVRTRSRTTSFTGQHAAVAFRLASHKREDGRFVALEPRRNARSGGAEHGLQPAIHVGV